MPLYYLCCHLFECVIVFTFFLFLFLVRSYDNPPIYNFVPDANNMSTWREYITFGTEYGKNLPLRKSIWYPRFTIVPTKFQFYILAFFYHTLPALFMDMLMLVIGKKPR